jgi:integrase
MSRYADPNDKTKKWTTKALEAIRPDAKNEILREIGGLAGEVRVSGTMAISVNFRFAFKWEGKKVWHYCGTWPATSLAEIRRARDDARRLAAEGVNPNDQRKAERIEAQAKVEAVIAEAAQNEADDLPVSAMFNAWLTDGVARADGNAELRRSFEKDVLPSIGATPVRVVTEHHLRALLRAMVKRGVHRMTVRTYNDIVQMFAWAEKRKPWRGLLTEGNPAELIELDKILPVDNTADKPRDRVFSADEVRELRDIFEQTTAAYLAAPAGTKYDVPRPIKAETQLALWITLGTACRIGELLMTRWEHVNFSTGEWFVPAKNTKTRADWRVYLSTFALDKFRSLHELTGDTPWCFPARMPVMGKHPETHVCVKSTSKQVGDRQTRFKKRSGPLKNRRNDNSLVLAGGTNGEWTPHDLRRTAATLMQSMRVSPDVIDRCQNHVLAGSKVRRHYLHHDYAEETRDAWRLLGDRLSAILNPPEEARPKNPVHALEIA